MDESQLEATPFTILLVEDDPAHAQLVMRSFEDHSTANEIRHVSDGEAVLDYLHRQGKYSDEEASPRPHLILLDLRLPRIDGLEVLNQIKATENLKTIPVVILTTSKAEADVTAAYERYANSYLVKPLDFSSFTELMEELGAYWLRWNQHPRRQRGV
jgi:CheY-like chemotaxis protein